MFALTFTLPCYCTLKLCIQFFLCCHLQSKHIAPQWPLIWVIIQSFCHFFHFDVLEAKKIRMQLPLLHTVKCWDYLTNHTFKFFWKFFNAEEQIISTAVATTPAMFICLSDAVYSTQLLKQPVIKNMLCKQNRNGGKADCVHLAFCIWNQAEGYKARFSVSLSPKGNVTHCSVPKRLRGWKAFFYLFCFVKMW